MSGVNYSEFPSRHLRSEIAHHWQQLSSSDVDQCCAGRSQLIQILQLRYGFAKRRAEQEADLFLSKFQERLRMAA